MESKDLIAKIHTIRNVNTEGFLDMCHKFSQLRTTIESENRDLLFQKGIV